MGDIIPVPERFLMLVYGRMVWGGYLNGELVLPGHDGTQIAALLQTLRLNHALGSSQLNLATSTLRIRLTVCELTETVADLLPAASPYDSTSRHVWLRIDQAADRLSHPLGELVRAYGHMTKKIRPARVCEAVHSANGDLGGTTTDDAPSQSQ